MDVYYVSLMLKSAILTSSIPPNIFALSIGLSSPYSGVKLNFLKIDLVGNSIPLTWVELELYPEL